VSTARRKSVLGILARPVRRIWWLAAVAAAARAFASETPADLKPTIAPPGIWVTPHFFDRRPTTAKLESSADHHWLLLERQINAAENQTFSHVVRQILTVSGVQNGANLSIDFNPAYQSLTLHWARIWRGAEHLDRLDANKVKMIRQERDLDRYILNGEQSAVLVLDDVRVGDIVDYAYSVDGANPIFAGRFSASVRAQLHEPIERLLTRVLWPSQRRLYTKAHGCTIQPTVTQKKEFFEYTWDLKQIAGIRLEDSQPVWYDPEPWVQLSEFKTWADVNQWALALFQNTSSLSSELSQKISEWKRMVIREQQILAVLRFVQDEVRYFGIELGESAEKPGDPSVVFSRRFGDCKDKALLFVSILRALGMEAYPALVNTVSCQSIQEWQPSADVFDHCIAVVQCDHQTYWLDPTAGYQRGSLGDHYLPNYARALMISPKTTELTVIPQAAGLPLTTTTEYFQLGGRAQASTLKVVTLAQGRDADNLRALFATQKRSEIEKKYLQLYSELYRGIKMSSPIELADNETQNRFQTTESYLIDKAWIRSGKDETYRCEFYPYAIASLLKKPADTMRRTPLGIRFPEHQLLRTEVTLPEAWLPEVDSKPISDPAFFFQKTCRCAGNRLVMEYEYRSLADSVMPNRATQYLQSVSEAAHSLGYSLIWR